MKTALTSAEALDRYFLETRCKIIEIAAHLDRIERGGGGASLEHAPQMRQIREALAVLGDGRPDRAVRCQRAFSLPYESSWRPPNAG